MSSTSGWYVPPRTWASDRTYPVPTYRVWLASGTTNGTSSGRTRSASKLSCGSRNSSADTVRKPTTAAAAATAPGTARLAWPRWFARLGRLAWPRRPAWLSPVRPSPTAAPTTGPSRTFCGRSPSAPAAAPATVATGTGPAPVTWSAAQPSGAATAPLAMIRDHRAGISPGRCRARATASTAPSPAAPASAPRAAARGPRWAARAAPASAPIKLAAPICWARSGPAVSSLAT